MYVFVCLFLSVYCLSGKIRVQQRCAGHNKNDNTSLLNDAKMQFRLKDHGNIFESVFGYFLLANS